MKLRLRTIRKINDYGQKQIADLLDVTQRTYSKYEIGELTLRIEQLIILRNYYGVSTDYLLGLVTKDKKSYTPKDFDASVLIKNLRYLRYENNYTQKELANLLNCSASLISMIEKNRSKVQIDMLVALAKIYNVTTESLLFTDDDE